VAVASLQPSKQVLLLLLLLVVLLPYWCLAVFEVALLLPLVRSVFVTENKRRFFPYIYPYEISIY
jgi:hypothetical protein